jgi:signal transduction histidine kinase
VSGAIRGVAGVTHDITAQYRLTKMQDDFLSVASHELRTPLTSLVHASRLLQRRLRKLDQTGRLGADIVSQT